MKKKILTLTSILLLAVMCISLVSCDDKEENSETSEYIEKTRINKDTSSLDNVYTMIKVALCDENCYQINTVDAGGNVKWVKLAYLLDDTTNTPITAGDYAPLAAELFDSSYMDETLDIGYTYKGGENGSPFKSKAAEGAEVYFAINYEGRAAVCLSRDGANVITAFGENGIVGNVEERISF